MARRSSFLNRSQNRTSRGRRILRTKKTGLRRFFLGEGISFLWGLVKIYVLGVYARYSITPSRNSVNKVAKTIKNNLCILHKFLLNFCIFSLFKQLSSFRNWFRPRFYAHPSHLLMYSQPCAILPPQFSDCFQDQPPAALCHEIFLLSRPLKACKCSCRPMAVFFMPCSKFPESSLNSPCRGLACLTAGKKNQGAF